MESPILKIQKQAEVICIYLRSQKKFSIDRLLVCAYIHDLKPTTKTISIRLPESLIEKLKILANKRDVPYQSLLKVLLAEKVDEELLTKS
ncbi:MAG: hypothetical protein F9K48_00275 [Candidatus Brocadia sp.]|nr:MAG: hypothetical protein F9K48_00275 [Candidatus Brocadia sp.]